MTQDRDNQPNPPGLDDDLNAQIRLVQEANRKTRIKWGAAGISVMLVSVGLFVLFAEQKTYFFRPNPDMKEVEHYSNKQANDPICNALLSDVDALQDTWKTHRVAMRDLSASQDPQELEEGLKRIQHFQTVYTFQRKRIGVMVTKSQSSQTEISKYVTHVLSYLRPMETILSARLQEIKEGRQPGEQGAESDEKTTKKSTTKTPKGMRSMNIPGLGKIAVHRPPARKGLDPDTPPAERYRKAWAAITEDHDKWRVFRQGVSPCGERRGEVPELLDDTPLQDLVKRNDTPQNASDKAPPQTADKPKTSAPQDKTSAH